MALAKVFTEVAHPTPAEPQRDLLAGTAVFAVWAGCSAVAAALVARSGRLLPYSDDWQLWPYVSGARPVTAGWLWEQHNEHRIPLVKAMHIVLLRAFNYDYRAPIIANLLALSFVALVLLLVARGLRGRTRLSDAAIPLLLLSPHLPPLQWGSQAQFTATVLALGLVLVTALDNPTAMSRRSLLLWSVAIVLLLTCGANGVAVVPVVAAGLFARTHWATHASPARRRLAVAIGVAGLAGIAAYFVGLHSTPSAWGRPGPAQLVATAVRLLAAPFGPAIEERWPLGGLAVVLALGVTARAWLRGRPRPPAAVLVVVIAGAALAGAVGLGRGGRPWDLGMSNHYAALFLPVVVAFVLAWAPSRARLAGVALGGVAVLSLVTYVDAVRDAGRVGDRLEAAQDRFEADARAGLDPAELAARHIRLFYFVDDPSTRAIVEAGVGEYLCATGRRPCPTP
jgi:hypothetical protein